MFKQPILSFNNNNLKILSFFYSIKYLDKKFYLAFYINYLKNSFICVIVKVHIYKYAIVRRVGNLANSHAF